MFLFPFLDDLVPLQLIPTLKIRCLVYKIRNQWKQPSIQWNLKKYFQVMVKNKNENLETMWKYLLTNRNPVSVSYFKLFTMIDYYIIKE